MKILSTAVAVLLLSTFALPVRAELDFRASDANLQAVLLDSSPSESFLGVQCDPQGRLFVGGREGLFVYDPLPDRTYKLRRQLARFPKDTWVYDIVLRGDDVYVATVSAVYVLPGAVTQRDRKKIKPQRLIWGVPLGHVHQCIHGLAWGPEGDLYISMGDPLWYYGDFARPDHWGHWTWFSQPEGTATPYNGVGGVFRCRPDGSHFQVVARGLRNSCGITFDRHWNLFTNDNDHEGLPAQYVPGRLLQVVPHAYYSWPRGWLLSKTPERADLLETLNEQLGRFVPVGQAYYDDPLLGKQYRNDLLVARWCIGAVTRYPLVDHGTTFHAEELHLLDGRNQARPVGVCVGRGGRVFVTISYMAQNEGSPIYKSDLVMVTSGDDTPSARFEAYDIQKASADKLFAELASDAWSRRNVAHLEILRRGGILLDRAAAQLRRTNDDSALAEHLVWLAAASRNADALTQVGRLAEKAPADVRVQALRAITEYGDADAAKATFIDALAAKEPKAQLAGLEGLFVCQGAPPQAVIEGPARSKDTFLRHVSAILLAEKAPLTELEALASSPDAATRLAATLAIGFKLTLPPVDQRVAGKLDKLREETSYVIQYADRKLDLRKFGPIGNYTVADHWKELPPSADQQQMFASLARLAEDRDEPVRLEAVHFLSLLNDPRSEPLVAKVIAANQQRKLSLEKLANITNVWLAGPFDDGREGFDRAHPPEQGAVDLSQEYPTKKKSIGWQQVKTARKFELTSIVGPMDHASCYAYFRFESDAKNPAELLVGSDDGVKVWQNGRAVWTNDVSRAALPYQDVVKLELEPGSNDILVRVRNHTGDSGLYLSWRALGNVAVVLPEKLAITGLADRLASAGGSEAIGKEFLATDWTKASAGGNPEQGRKLFEAIGCAKCHATKADAAGTGGPSLAEAGKRFTVSHLVESILLPSKQISPVFKASQVVLSDGRTLKGLLVGETAEKIELLLPDTKRVSVAKNEIEHRELLNQSPMPQGVVKKPEELGDLLAYLLRGT